VLEVVHAAKAFSGQFSAARMSGEGVLLIPQASRSHCSRAEGQFK